MTYEEVQEKAEKLCNRLGDKWEPKVWHNLYWCYSANLGNKISVHEDGDSWSAYYTPNSIVVGHSTESPMGAVLHLYQSYRKAYEQRKSQFEEFKKAIEQLGI